MTNDITLNRDLHEKVMGKCWHDWEALPFFTKEKKPSYTTNPADYWELLQKVADHKSFIKFWEKIDGGREFGIYILLDMPRGCQAIWEFFVNAEKP